MRSQTGSSFLFNPRIDTIPVWYIPSTLSRCLLVVHSRRFRTSFAKRTIFMSSWSVLHAFSACPSICSLDAQALALSMPKHLFSGCPSIGLSMPDASTLRFHWMECSPCWYNEVLLVIVNKDELIKHMCYNSRSAGLFNPWNTYTYPSPINEGYSHLLNYV